MSYKPPFTITTEILNLVAEISEQVGRLNASAPNSPPPEGCPKGGVVKR